MAPDSFVDFLHAWGEHQPPSLRWHDDEPFADWQQRFRAAVESLRGPVPERVPLDVDMTRSWDEAEHVRHLVRTPVSAITRLVAYLLTPMGIRDGERRPGLIVSHGHAAHGIDSVCGVVLDEGEDPRRAYALDAVRAGYVVLAPAWWGWHGRDGHLDLVGRRDKCNVIQIAAGMYGLNVIDLHIQDGQAALDLLASRPEVDPMRLGCLGNSYGGRTTMWLTISDERIRACVCAGCLNHFRERSLKLSSCGVQYPFGLLRHGDVPELFGLIAPRPMQLQAGAEDPLITPADRDAMASLVRRGYRALAAEERLDYVVHPEGHLLRWDLAAPFLARHLGRVRAEEP